jgi:methionyl-tRNA formyltransferase
MNIVFFGTSPFAVTLLRGLLKQKINIVAVVTRADKPQGRSLKISSPPVKELILESHPDIPILQPHKASTPEFIDQLRQFNPDLFVVAAYGEILKQSLLDLPKHGAINVHGSLLPKYRGAAPIQRCLMNGDLVTGITILKMVLEMDAGDMLAKETLNLSADATFGDLEQKLSQISCPALIHVLRQIESGTVQATEQDPAEVTFAPKINPVETEIKWNHSATNIHNLIRGLSPQPGAWCWVQVGGDKKRLKIKRTAVIDGMKGYFGENLVFSDQEWIVACEKGALKLLEVQLEGKKSLNITEFLRGFHEPCKIIS